MKAFLRDPQKYFTNELEAAIWKGTRKLNRATITLVGPGRAGKTCIARSLLNMSFENTPSTQGIDDLGLRTTVHQAEAREGRWGEFREFEKMCEGHLALQILDTERDSKASPEKGQNKREEAVVGAYAEQGEVNDRADGPEQQSSLLSIPVDVTYVLKTIGEIRSDGQGLVVSIHDFGGQRVFDVIHSFFLGPNGVYVVVFNLEWMLSEFRGSCLDHLQSWVNALIVHSSVTDEYGKLKCASIVLVGTHKDTVPDTETHRDISKTLDALLGRSVAWRSILENESEGLCFFPVDCTQGQADPTMVNLMTAIETDILESDYVKVERPLSYFKVLDEMNERKKTVPCLSLHEVSDISNKYKVGSQDMIEDMLRLFRELGLIMWHEEHSLRNVVILDPVKFFVSPASNIICQHTEDEQGTIHSNYTLKKAYKRFRNDFEELKNGGVVSSVLLKFILQEHLRESTQSDELLLKLFEAVRDLMIKYSFLIPMYDKTKEDEFLETDPIEYLVPSLLRAPNETGELVPNKKAIFLFCFINCPDKLVSTLSDLQKCGFVPPGLFQRYVARIHTEVDATKGGQDFKFLHKDQVSFYIGPTEITLTALNKKGVIMIEYVGEHVYGPLKLMIEIMAEVKTECFRQLEAATMAPFPPNANKVKELIRLDKLNAMEKDFTLNDIKYSINEMKAAYATLLQPNVSEQSFDLFISYKWGKPQQSIVRFMYSRLSRTLIQEECNRPLLVYLDERENKIGDNFAVKFCSAFKGLKIFLPLVSEESLQRMKNHNPSIVDYVLAEWMIALSTGCRILPILLGPQKDEKSWEKLDLSALKEVLPDIYPEKTAKFVKEHLLKVGMMDNAQQISETAEWTVKNLVERFFRNLYLNWKTKASLLECRSRILEILKELRPHKISKDFFPHSHSIFWGTLIFGVMVAVGAWCMVKLLSPF